MGDIAAVIFDLDGLMADSEPLAEWAWKQILARYGHELDAHTFQSIQGLRVADSAALLCARFALPISPEEAQAERERLVLEAIPARLQAKPGLYHLLSELETRALPLGLATSSSLAHARLSLQVLGVAERFRAIATGDDVTKGKPAPDLYLTAAERLGVPPPRCLALDDSPPGIEAAIAAGMFPVAVPTAWTATLEFSGCRVFSSLYEVAASLDELLSEPPAVRYLAAGGIVTRDGYVLVLRRPKRGEIRLPKGHVERGETAVETALRETQEESGYGNLTVRDDLGTRTVEFTHPDGRHIIRTERYFLLTLTDQADERTPQPAKGAHEDQFEPLWLPWDEALEALTFEAEQEWVRLARARMGSS
ncbi:MAG: HAD-IA family hydrolase [Anaerolineae bacterium]|nr:HAD-IA family hydrolase [Anaerolineae bacterium]